jgi:hypothetical protein
MNPVTVRALVIASRTPPEPLAVSTRTTQHGRTEVRPEQGDLHSTRQWRRPAERHKYSAIRRWDG